MSNGTKACQYCYGKKIKCVRGSEHEPCKKCAKLKLQCINRAHKRIAVVSEDLMEQLRLENEKLKEEVLVLASENKILRSRKEFQNSTHQVGSHSPFEASTSNALSDCVRATTSTFNFCKFMYGYLGGNEREFPHAEMLPKENSWTSESKFSHLPLKELSVSLLETAYHFLCNDYHLAELSDTLHILEKVYKVGPELVDRIELARLFLLLSLGKLYTTPLNVEVGKHPGFEYFREGMLLIEDQFYVASTTQIEVLLLVALFFNSLSLLNYSYLYLGICIRSAKLLRLDNERENITEHKSYRLRCTIYMLEVSLCTSLGFTTLMPTPNIDFWQSVENIPDPQGNSYFISKRFALAKINERIINEIYVDNRTLVQIMSSIRQVISDLDHLYSEIMVDTKAISGISQRSFERSTISLRLRFNECMMLATRPLIFAALTDDWSHFLDVSTDSNLVALALAEFCIHAAMKNVNIIHKIFRNRELSYYGYYDVNSLFASAVILSIASCIDYFSNVVSLDDQMDIEHVSELTISMMLAISAIGNPSAKLFLDALEELRNKLKGWSSNPIKKNQQSQFHNLTYDKFEWIIDEYSPSRFDFNFFDENENQV